MTRSSALARACLGATLALIVLAPPRAARAQTDLDRDPGYVDFRRLDAWFREEPTVEIDVRGALLRMVASSSRSEDPELAAMLGRLRAVQVRTYRLTPTAREGVRGRTSDLARSLRGLGWESVVRVRSEGDHVDMFLRQTADRISGLMVMVVGSDESADDGDDDDVVFINIVGEVEPEQVGRIGKRFGVKHLSGHD